MKRREMFACTMNNSSKIGAFMYDAINCRRKATTKFSHIIAESWIHIWGNFYCAMKHLQQSCIDPTFSHCHASLLSGGRQERQLFSAIPQSLMDIVLSRGVKAHLHHLSETFLPEQEVQSSWKSISPDWRVPRKMFIHPHIVSFVLNFQFGSVERLFPLVW